MVEDDSKVAGRGLVWIADVLRVIGADGKYS
jgi:hypothetical protein